ncbi:MAG: hypothetical protein RMJ43_01335 [Chloroherpetonaceae bacterium]|nr:hypothetical protein [Chthonomonadaceae bacterium]MDW8206451.1 hypothetical protein [Chloroherpetonaceae bacterium]
MWHFDWDAELPEAERDALIEQVARLVDARGLHLPAIWFLELHKPLCFLASQSVLLGSGFLVPLFGPHRVQQWARLLESRDNVERLIQRIEQMSASHHTMRREHGTCEHDGADTRAVDECDHRCHDPDGPAQTVVHPPHSGPDRDR